MTRRQLIVVGAGMGGLAAAITAADVDVVLVGDCAAPRTVLEAIREGRAAARGDLRGFLARGA